MYRNFNIELLNAYLNVSLKPIFKNKYNDNTLETQINKIIDKKKLVISNFIKFPLIIKGEEFVITENEKDEYIKYCDDTIRHLKRTISFEKMINNINDNK